MKLLLKFFLLLIVFDTFSLSIINQTCKPVWLRIRYKLANGEEGLLLPTKEVEGYFPQTPIYKESFLLTDKELLVSPNICWVPKNATKPLVVSLLSSFEYAVPAERLVELKIRVWFEKNKPDFSIDFDTSKPISKVDNTSIYALCYDFTQHNSNRLSQIIVLTNDFDEERADGRPWPLKVDSVGEYDSIIYLNKYYKIELFKTSYKDFVKDIKSKENLIIGGKSH